MTKPDMTTTKDKVTITVEQDAKMLNNILTKKFFSTMC